MIMCNLDGKIQEILEEHKLTNALIKRLISLEENPLQKVFVNDEDLLNDLKKHKFMDSVEFGRRYNVSRPTALKKMKEFAHRYSQDVGYIVGKHMQPSRIYLKNFNNSNNTI